jgi:hypothetical protein
MMIIDCKLGDRVLIYVDAMGGVLSYKSSDSLKTLVGTIFGINKHNGERLIGWKSAETPPSDAGVRDPSSPLSYDIDYLPEQREYVMRIFANRRWEVAGKEEKPWQQFANKTPGECPCGGTRGVCQYHP